MRVLITILVICGMLVGWIFFQPANIFDRSKIMVEIPKGASTQSIQSLLEEKGVIRKGISFKLVTRLFGFQKHFQAGKYLLSPSDPLIGVLLKIKAGDIYIPAPDKIWVTFPEGDSIYVMGETLKEKKVDWYKDFQALAEAGITEELRENHWELFKYIPSESLEGYLYPDTYWFFEDVKMDQLVEAMLARFEEVVLPFWQVASQETEYSLHEIITLASIIEKEAQIPTERTIVSSVYHNRLNANMYLAACPTIKYVLKYPTKKVYYEQLEVESPYNTYKHKGLPPGPVCNPGIESIKAAVYPAETNYYYFVSKHDGGHVFSSTWKEHEKAKWKYGE